MRAREPKRAALPRGVYYMPWRDSDGQLVLMAIDSNNRRVAEMSVPHARQDIGIVDQLWDRLEAEDPEPQAIDERKPRPKLTLLK